ncbi:unnamed protein product [Amoebophrya sp. A25]|nr:unnamed protein product [Amoebophrya sp. A25]|eukprot:GSA25T00009194001.1
MYVEEVRIDGFKSYSTLVKVGPFDRQFNAITGQNGTGKSNILDSICFVLGITNLSQVRVASLSELVYKQGQAGVTKASVTVVFNNEDKANAPIGYKDPDKIEVTRQVVIQGRNRWFINNQAKQQGDVANLFQSVQLNVNNPHFLIMQGRITKVINMKPHETLAMIEEAAGTKMYEVKKQQSLRNLEKKKGKVDNINRVLEEEISPTIKKLEQEKKNFLQWSANNHEIERLMRFNNAADFLGWKKKEEAARGEKEDAAKMLETRVEERTTLGARLEALAEEMKEKLAGREEGDEMKAAKKQQKDLKAEVKKAENTLANKKASAVKEQKKREKAEKDFKDVEATREQKTAQVAEAARKRDEQKSKMDAFTHEIAEFKRKIQALSAGVSENNEEGASVHQQVLDVQRQIQEHEGKKSRAGLKKRALLQDIPEQEKRMKSLQSDIKKQDENIAKLEQQMESAKHKLESCGFTPEERDDCTQKYENAKAQKNQHWNAMQEKGMWRRYESYIADYTPPPGFDRSRVKGSVIQLLKIKEGYEDCIDAFEIMAGNKLANVIVDGPETSKLLIAEKCMKHRTTFVPLVGLEKNPLSQRRLDRAREIAAQKGCKKLITRLIDVIQFPSDLRSAFEFLFGNVLIVEDTAHARAIFDHKEVSTVCVTKLGDTYNPSGLVSGGGKPQGAGRLRQFGEYRELKSQYAKIEETIKSEEARWAQLMANQSKYRKLDDDVRILRTKLEGLFELRETSTGGQVEAQIQRMRLELQELEAFLESYDSHEETLQRQFQSLKKEQETLNSSAGDRQKQYQKEIELREKEKKPVEKELSKAELEVGRLTGEQQSTEEDSLRAHKAAEDAQKAYHTLETECENLAGELETNRKTLEEINAKVEEFEDTVKRCSAEVLDLQKEKREADRRMTDLELEVKHAEQTLEKATKDVKESAGVVQAWLKKHPWIIKEEPFFGKKGSDFDFERTCPKEAKRRQTDLEMQQKTLSRGVNKKVMTQFESAQRQHDELISKRNILVNDKQSIDQLIEDLDKKKETALRATCATVNKNFGEIFAALLHGAFAKLEAPQEMDELEGLEIKVAFNGKWQASLQPLSGGQKSLLALSLVLALLKFKPAPMYILDEVDAALDLSHTQNIGMMIKHHFPHSQFIIVSLKQGMFDNANVLFRTAFVDGCSQVTRKAIKQDTKPKDKDGAVEEKGADGDGQRKTKRRKPGLDAGNLLGA